MTDQRDTIPWVSFCMSTYKRPQFLQTQLHILAQQSFANFEVVISDNDPAQSAAPVVAALQDDRFKYFSNGDNLGMVGSFNKSIDRASGEFIVMITDDDPVTENFLSEMHDLYKSNPTLSLYAGFIRRDLQDDGEELITADDFVKEILNVDKTPWLLWSSCIMRKTSVLEVGKMPDFGSPHFADHALIAMVGGLQGGLIKKKMFSSLSSHEDNFSKSNFHTYVKGCIGFYELMEQHSKNRKFKIEEKKVVISHLGRWFFGCIFTLKKYFYINRNQSQYDAIVACAVEILKLPFMLRFRTKYYAKSVIFEIKKVLLFKRQS